ncbi:MAG: rhomboid family intrarane serine protease [Deltaproteobacteria bacterium]|nr:rhomboid family intrarane serine protease [Deltaproteobacteria bacterium]
MPWATIGIIAVCALVQVYASAIAETSDDVVLGFGYVTGSGLGTSLITSAFVHGGWLHLIGNMLFLLLAGAALEDRWGAVRFVAFYLLGAAAATLTFDFMYHGEPTLLVGASGAVATTMGAFLVCFARTKITLWYWFYRSTGTFQMAAYLALPLWLAEQLLLTSFERGSDVAYDAHIGGFAFGSAVALVVRLLRPTVSEDAEAEADVDVRPAAPREVVADRPRAPHVDPHPFRASPRSAPIVAVRPATSSHVPFVRDPNAEDPKLLR